MNTASSPITASTFACAWLSMPVSWRTSFASVVTSGSQDDLIGRHHRLCVVAMHPAAARLHDAAVRISRVRSPVGIHARVGFFRLAPPLALPGRLLLHVPRRDLLLLASGGRRGAVRQLLPARLQPDQAVAAALQVRRQRRPAALGPELAP